MPDQLKAFWSIRESLAVHDGIVFAGTRIVIPYSLRADVLQRLHAGHMGIEKTRS